MSGDGIYTVLVFGVEQALHSDMIVPMIARPRQNDCMNGLWAPGGVRGFTFGVLMDSSVVY